MTAELCVMNRHAVVLAADSATTATREIVDGHETRYFKGANKIFQISNSKPVALMIFDSADIMGVPWELIAKEFRSFLGAKSFNSISEYASEFVSFLDSDARLFPAEVQARYTLRHARDAALRAACVLREDDEDDDDTYRARIVASLGEQHAVLTAAPLPERLTADDVQRTFATHHAELKHALEAVAALPTWILPEDLTALADVGLLTLLKAPGQVLETTGLVFAGYGDHDIFPSMREYASAGVVAGKHIISEKSAAAITHELPAAIAGFAQTAMSDTFQLGFAFDIFNAAMSSIDTALRELAGEVAGRCGREPGEVADLEALLKAKRDEVSASWIERARADHIIPMRSVLGILPIDEMAELAETLINLQSLKEKVTKPSESVGGPIDVAVITRSEGLVWIKRKHYFDPAINSRFIQRQAALYAS